MMGAAKGCTIGDQQLGGQLAGLLDVGALPARLNRAPWRVSSMAGRFSPKASKSRNSRFSPGIDPVADHPDRRGAPRR